MPKAVRLLVPLLALALPSLCAAQAVAPDETSVSVGYEWHRDRLRYSFDALSSFDTSVLVPHNYTQTYWADNHWLVARARYSVGGNHFTSEFGATPPVTARASDIDTFFNPGDDVITSGTDGAADLRAWRLAQWSHGGIGRLPLSVGYRYRRDHAEFAPADIVVTHSNPPSVTRRFTTDEESTVSQVHEFVVMTSRRLAQTSRWRVDARVSSSPIVIARLATRLPQKYPGRTIRSDARAAAFTARLEAASLSKVPLVVGVEWGKSLSYRASQSFDRDALELSVGLVWRR